MDFIPQLHKRKSNKSIINRVFQSQITGNCSQQVGTLPTGLIKRINKEHDEILDIVVELKNAHLSGDIKECRKPLRNATKRVIETPATTHKDDRNAFFYFDGPLLLMDTFSLYIETLEKRKNVKAMDSSSYQTTQEKLVLNKAMSILRELCVYRSSLPRNLCKNKDFLLFLFSLIPDSMLFDNAVGLTEELLAAKRDTFDLSEIENFGDLLRGLSTRQLAYFCRILSLAVFEPEDRYLMETSKILKSVELLDLRNRKIMNQNSSIDRNHAILFNIKEFIPRIVLLIQIQNASPVDQWPEQILSRFPSTREMLALIGGMNEQSDWDDVYSLANGYSFQSSRSQEDIDAELRLKAFTLAPHQVEVLFVLCTILGGKRKLDIQNKLAKLGLLDILHKMFDRLSWRTPHLHISASDERIHGPECECNPDSALRVQYLRLIHNFCDGEYNASPNRMLLLSKEELELLHDGTLTPISTTRNNMGLLCKIISVLIREPSNSIYRFWLASCVEAFLRGATREEQIFVARTQLLNNLINHVLHDDVSTSSGSLQTAFDLLGELTKENEAVFSMLSAILYPDKADKLMRVCVNHLVDSNVFFRSILLSMEKLYPGELFNEMNGSFEFIKDESGIKPYQYNVNCIEKFISRNLLHLLKDLMTIVSLEEINHENICCLNTAVAIFLFAHRRQKIPFILKTLKEAEKLAGVPNYINYNFRMLLWFWNEYYTYRGRDQMHLELSSHVSFSEWKNVVNLLCADNESTTSLLNQPCRLPMSPYIRHYQIFLKERK